MKTFDFYTPACRTQITAPHFGLCDREDGCKAHVDCENPDAWIVAVENKRRLALIFTAVDKCVIKDGEAEESGRCDGMLTSEQHLYFIELKDKKHTKSGRAKAQLVSTIEIFKRSHPEKLNEYRIKKVFICNKGGRKNSFCTHEEQKRFHETYGFRIEINPRTIVVTKK
jgi:hypothetical protein